MKLLIKDQISIHEPFDKLVHRGRYSKSTHIEQNKITKTEIDIDFVYRYSTLNNNKIFNAVITPYPGESSSSLISLKTLPSHMFGIPFFLGCFLAFLAWRDFFNFKTGLIIWIVALIAHYLYTLIKFQDNKDQLLAELSNKD